MSQLPFIWIDAFTKKPLGGNPCAVVLDADELSTEQMQSIACEMNLSETAFVMKSNKADFAARYFTPTEELPFAGHPTLSSIYALMTEGRLSIESPLTYLTLEVPAGIIPIEVIKDSGDIKIVMSQLKPQFLRIYDPAEILPLFNLSLTDLIPNIPIQTVSTGTPILMIPLKNHDALKRAQHVDENTYFRLKASADFSFAHHFCLEGATPQGQTFARSLGVPPFGLEDPFTGSATGCMAAYLWKYGLIQGPYFVAEQGHWMKRPGRAEIEIIGSRDDIQTIRLKGEAVSLISGKINTGNLL